MKITSYFICIGVFLFAPLVSSAYVTTNQTASLLEDTAVVFTIEYGFSSSKETLRLPVLGYETASDTTFGYTLLDDEEPYAVYDASYGFVISDAPIVDGMYEVRPGSGHTFTAIIIAVVPETAATQTLSAHLDEMPLYKGEERRPLPLNPSQLQYYITPPVTI